MKWSRSTNLRRNKSDISSEDTKIVSLGKSDSENSEDNKIFFYEEINKDSILSLSKQIDETNKLLNNLKFSYNLTEIPPVEIHICSEGGDVMPALGVIDKITSNPFPVHTYVEGIVASAASLISVSGHKRFITENSSILIHQISTDFWGNYSNFQDEMQNLNFLMSVIKNVYLKHTDFKEENLKDLLNHDLLLSANTCFELGLVDKIL